MTPRNNFDLLRFVFAFMVVLSHSHWLSDEAALAPLSRMVSTRLAVKGFFIVSGYLIFMSYDRSKSLRDYAGKRVRRIYPAYAAVIFGSAILGAFLTTLTFREYCLPMLRYLAANLVFLNPLAPSLPGVFTANTTTQVNPALWTLKIEVMFYASVPVLAWLCARAGRTRTLAAIYLLSAAYVVVLGHYIDKTGSAGLDQLQRQLPGQLSYFVAGAAGYYYFAFLERRWAPLLASSALALAGLHFFPTAIGRALLEPAALAVLVLWAALAWPFLGNFARFGDFSYGIYILHCPVIQTLTAFGVFHRHPWGGFAQAVTLILVLAAICWHLVEQPFLRKNSHYRRGGTPDVAAATPD